MDVNATIASAGIPELAARTRETIKRQVQEWFDLCDRILDVHRSHFVFREPTSAQLREHKSVLRSIIRTCLLINAWVSDPDSNEPDLASRLQIRIKQLEDAYSTFHDPTVSDEKADQVLKDVFPE